ncbi:MAG TPA: membrane protein insertase YidC [Allosphingosinicella sp.]
MNESRNLILAIALSLVVLLGWSALSQQFFPTAEQPSTKFEKGKQVPVQQPGSLPTAAPETPRTLRDRNLVLRETPRVAIETPSLRGSINLQGARIDDLVLIRHTETMAPDSPPIRLFAPAGTQDSYFAHFGWQGQGVRLPDPQAVWRPSAPRLAPGRPVTLSWDNGQGQLFEIQLAVDENYLFTAEQRVINRGGAPVVVRPFSLISRVGESRDRDDWTMHVGPVGVFNGTANYNNDYSAIVTERQRQFSSTGGWLGFSDKYWLSAIIPHQQQPVDAALRHNPDSNSFQADVTNPAAVVAPGQITRTPSYLYAGAKEVSLLESYETSLGTPIDKAIDWGWYEWFMRPIFSLLVWLFGAIGNFGVAIICLTLIVRLLLFPVAQRQFASFGKMRAIQPKVQALQERYKDDKPRLQQEMLKLYREEKANPAAGCLPVLLQIPIFYALYRVLIVAVEMRHQPFALWIKDLSAPDPLTPVNLFGFLPFDPPAILAVGVLPILVGITMWIQQKLNPPVPDPVQRKIFGFLPWVLMVVMAPFAAGLQLYWVTNNLLSIAQQRLLYARNPEMRSPAPARPGPPAPAAPDKPSLAKPGDSGRRGGGGGRKPKSR